MRDEYETRSRREVCVMNSEKRELVPAQGLGVEDPKRRDLAMALLGVLGGATVFQACGNGGKSMAAPSTCPCPNPQTIAVDTIGVSPLTGSDLNLRGLEGSP